MYGLLSLKFIIILSLSFIWENMFIRNNAFWKRNFIMVLNGFNKWRANILEMWINRDGIRYGWRNQSQFPANRNQRTRRVRTRLLIYGLSRKTRLICGWIRRRASPSRRLFNKDHPLVLCARDRSFETRSSICRRLETPFELFAVIRPCQWNRSAL